MSTLQRGLRARHICMIALGGSLGTGIFLTSGSALYIAGPGGALIAYLIMGFIVYLLMNSLGEMAAYHPVPGSFCQYASEYVSKSFGFAMGYNYWFNWAITIAVELIAAALIMKFWFPNIPTIDWCILFFCAIFTLNLLSVRHYGEAEYWLSIIKVVAILVFILIGIFVILTHHSAHHFINAQNWEIGSTPFHGGIASLCTVFLLSGFSFQGTELVGIAAGEAEEPKKIIPRAIKQVFWRILIFYILTMLVISFIIPYTDPHLLNIQNSVAYSPFTLVLIKLGLHNTADIMNAVILAALLSACNSDMYSATRILWHLAEEGSAPRILSHTNRFGIPIYALITTASFGSLAFLCHLLGGTMLFLWLVNISSLAGFIAWFAIALSHYRFRKAYLAAGNQSRDLPFQAKWYPFAPIAVAVICSIIIIGQAYILLQQHQFNISHLIATYAGLPIVLLLWVIHAWKQQRKPCSQQAVGAQ